MKPPSSAVLAGTEALPCRSWQPLLVEHFNGGCSNVAHAVLAHHQAEAENGLIRSVSVWQSCDVTS